jgi:hypothetical protein
MTSLQAKMVGCVLLLAGSTVGCTVGTATGAIDDGRAATSDEPVAETPSTPDPTPARLRVAHMWERRDAVDVCVMDSGEIGEGVRPMYRAQGAPADRVVGGVPQYKVGKYVRFAPHTRVLKLVAADAADCAAEAIATQEIDLPSGTQVTVVLWGDDSQRVRLETVTDSRTPEQKAESVRFYDFSIDPSMVRRTWFDQTRLHNFRLTPTDVVLQPNQAGRFAHEVADRQVSTNHETRALGIVTVFAAGVPADDTFRIVVCRDDERVAGALSDCQ